MKKILVIVDADLDGAGSFLAIREAMPADTYKVVYKVTTVKSFKKDFDQFDFSQYSKVFICDLPIYDYAYICDYPNVVVIDHHEQHVENSHVWKIAKQVVKMETSCTKLICDVFKIKDKLSKPMVTLFALIDDYDSYTLKFPFSKDLDFIYWGYTGDKLGKFIDDFGTGFVGFNKFHKNALHIIHNEINQIIVQTKMYGTQIPIGDKQFKMLSCCAEKWPNEIAGRMLEKYGYDFILIINPKMKKAYLRSTNECKLHMGELAEKLGQGGGHECAAGVALNENVMNLTKPLKLL
jgi:single-stranded DNA-specific DHH superfamily exonuclease